MAGLRRLLSTVYRALLKHCLGRVRGYSKIVRYLSVTLSCIGQPSDAIFLKEVSGLILILSWVSTYVMVIYQLVQRASHFCALVQTENPHIHHWACGLWKGAGFSGPDVPIFSQYLR